MVLLDLEKLVAPPEREREGPRVRIKTKEKCPKCGRAFAETPLGYLCLKCKTIPRRFYIYLSWNGRKIRIYSFRDGQPLSSWELAQRARQLIEHEIQSGIFDPTRWLKGELQNYLYQNLLQDYLESKRREIKPASLRDKKILLEKIGEILKVANVREIQSVHLHKLFTELSRRGLAPKTIRNYFTELKAFLNWLRRRGIIHEVPLGPEIKVPEPQIKWLDPETQARILGEIPEEHRPIFEFMFLTGCRPGEARALQWDAVHLKEGFVIIKRTFSYNKLVEIHKEGKAKAIPLVGRLGELFRELARDKKSVFVFCHYHFSRKWVPYGDKILGRLFKEACRKVGVEGITLYQAVRHSFAMQLLQLGFTYEQVGAALGHSHPSTTRKYGRLQAHMVASVFEAKQNIVSLEEVRKKRAKNDQEG